MNQQTKLLLILLLIAVPSLIYYSFRVDTKLATPAPESVQPAPTSMADAGCTPTFADGGGPYYLPNTPFRDVIHPAQYTGDKLIVSGKLLNNDCQTPVADAVLDVWQADDKGEYVNDWYRGNIRTDAGGNYRFETVVPKGYGEGTGQRPPHIHFKVFISEKEIITSQMFFPETRGTPGFDDAYIMNTETKEEDGKPVHYGTHDIILP